MTRPFAPRRLPAETVCHDPLDIENICLGPRHFWPRDRPDIAFCAYLTFLNFVLLVVIGLYLGGI